MSNMPTRTGARTTLTVAAKRASPLMGTRLLTRSKTRVGVMTAARMVEQAVRSTDRATLAPAMRLTRLEAVPPGEHPTKTRPR